MIAEAWDASFALYDGVPGPADLDRLAATLPRQEAARFAPTEIVLSRANKSMRLFSHVVERLAAGRQPEAGEIGRVGYLMRTTAVYGNGKFGIADRAALAERPEFAGSFQAEMLAVWLIRGFTLDLVEHIAAARGGAGAARLAPHLRRHLGIGNSTGLGMAPFLVTHPVLLDAWIGARETALARVRAVERGAEAARARMPELLARAEAHLGEWEVADTRQAARIARLRGEMAELARVASPDWLAGPRPWERMMALASGWSAEAQELVVSLLLEPHGDLVDDLAETMLDRTGPRLDPAMALADLRAHLAADYPWALEIDFDDPAETARFWYVSEEKAEPRLGERGVDPGESYETPLDIARQVARLADDLEGWDGAAPVAAFLLARPEHRHAVRRVQTTARAPYAEIRDNLIGAACLPIDLLRAKLAVFGASKFDPRSDRWTRVTLFQGAPGFGEVAAPGADDWAFPALGRG